MSLVSLLMFSIVGQSPPPDIPTLIQGIVNRSEAVTSGEMAYSQASGFPHGRRGMEHLDFQVLFSGSSWRKYSKISMSKMPRYGPNPLQKKKLETPKTKPRQGFYERTEVSHRGKYVEYRQVPQPDGHVRRSADIQGAKPIRHVLPFPPVFAGSFWYPATRDFVRDHALKAVHKGRKKVNGVMCEVLEWHVSKADRYKAFHATDDLTSKGGKLCLYTMPAMGYVLARYEYIGQNGYVAASFDAVEFVKHAKGIYIPRKCVMQYFDFTGPGFRIANTLTSVKRINASIADKKFIVSLIPGTVAYDGRYGDRSLVSIITKDAAILADLNDIIRISEPPPSPTPKPANRENVVATSDATVSAWNRQTGLWMGVGAGVCLVLVGVYLGKRWFFPRKKRATDIGKPPRNL